MPPARLCSGSNFKHLGITGINGLLGWHLRCYLKSNPTVTVHGADRLIFQDQNKLTNFIDKCEIIVHFAGMNRGEEDLIEKTNISLMDSLLNACKKSGQKPHIIFASSTHVNRDTAYARSKRAATDMLVEWSNKTGGKATVLILPNVFGEAGKPFYNSVVSTFAYQIANNKIPKIEIDREMELLHAQEVAEIVIEVASNRKYGEIRPAGSKMTVSGLLEKLHVFYQQYSSDLLPELPTPFDVSLFNTLRYYMFPGFYPKHLALRSDARGHLYEAVKNLGGGQTFLSTTRPGVTRGNHFHYKNVERFLVVSGQANIKVRKLFSDHIDSFEVNGKTPAYVDMPTLHTHSITNSGDSDLITLFWSNSVFDPVYPDTVREPV